VFAKVLNLQLLSDFAVIYLACVTLPLWCTVLVLVLEKGLVYITDCDKTAEVGIA